MILLALASPALGLRLAWTDEGNYPEATDTHQAYDLLADGFGDGFNGPFLITASVPSGGSLIDATLVRMILVPATMALLGDRNWWMPRWLRWVLPRLTIETVDEHVDVA